MYTKNKVCPLCGKPCNRGYYSTGGLFEIVKPNSDFPLFKAGDKIILAGDYSEQRGIDYDCEDGVTNYDIQVVDDSFNSLSKTDIQAISKQAEDVSEYTSRTEFYSDLVTCGDDPESLLIVDRVKFLGETPCHIHRGF